MFGIKILFVYINKYHVYLFGRLFMKVGIIVALKKEFDLITNILDAPLVKRIKHLTFNEGTFGDNQIVLVQSGIGKVNAAAATVEMIDNFAPDKIINTGVAGGADPILSVMDMVVASEIVYHDVWCGEGEYGQIQGLPTFFQTDEELRQKLIDTADPEAHLYYGLIASGDKFISDIEEIRNIKSRFSNTLAVDMESAAIAQICYLYKIPFLSMRTISDTPGIQNHYQQYLDFWRDAPLRSFEVVKSLLS